MKRYINGVLSVNNNYFDKSHSIKITFNENVEIKQGDVLFMEQKVGLAGAEILDIYIIRKETNGEEE